MIEYYHSSVKKKKIFYEKQNTVFIFCLFILGYTFTQNEKYSTDDNEKQW